MDSKLLLGLLLLSTACAGPDHITSYGVHIYNDTPFELNYDEFDFMTAEAVKLQGGSVSLLKGFEFHFVEEAVTPGGEVVGGWTAVNGGHGEVRVSQQYACMSTMTAYVHEVLHILRGPLSADRLHLQEHTWGKIDGPWRVIGVEQAVERRSGKKYCGLAETIKSTPGAREMVGGEK